MNYRHAVVGDIPVIAAMNLAMIRDTGHRNPMNREQLADRLAGWLRGDYRAVLFEDANATAGYALYRVDPDGIYLRQFFVAPEFRRRGVGRGALAWLLAVEWRGRRIRLEALMGNRAAIAFWHAVGFKEYGVILEREPDA